MITPLLSESDPVSASEGSLDPLGLYSVADKLAVQLAPGVRERQARPRFLTSMAVSYYVCSEFNEECIAADGISPPWQVFEWYLVEGLVRTIKDAKFLAHLPGRTKVGTCVNDCVPVTARRYLKTPSVFGYHGVYRTLARELGLDVAGCLGEFGYELLTQWAKEQDLDGFVGSSRGPGKRYRLMLNDAVRDSLESGETARSRGWGGWQFFEDYLHPGKIGRKEAKTIRNALLYGSESLRGEMLRFIVSPEGCRILAQDKDIGIIEREIHSTIIKNGECMVVQLLRTIGEFELFARYLQGAFDDCLKEMSLTRGKVMPEKLADLPSVIIASKKVPEIYDNLPDMLAPYGLSVELSDRFGMISVRTSSAEWIELLLEHHRKIQTNKPPYGKMPWFDRYDDGGCIIRPGYIRTKGGRYDNAYVHFYRTMPLYNFAHDLYMVK